MTKTKPENTNYDLRGEWCRITGVSLQQAYADIRSGMIATDSNGRIDMEATLRNVRQTRRVKTAAELQETELDVDIKRTKLDIDRTRLTGIVQEIQDEALSVVHNALTIAIADFASRTEGRKDIAAVATEFRKTIERVIKQTLSTEKQ